MIDRRHIGKLSKRYAVEVEKGALAYFSRTVSEIDPVHFDEFAARAVGHPNMLAPPTYVFTLSLSEPDRGSQFAELAIDPARVLHAEQHFEYRAPVYAGDTITFEMRLVDVYEKKGGALEFFVNGITGTNQNGVEVVRMRCTCVVRH